MPYDGAWNNGCSAQQPHDNPGVSGKTLDVSHIYVIADLFFFLKEKGLTWSDAHAEFALKAWVLSGAAEQEVRQ